MELAPVLETAPHATLAGERCPERWQGEGAWEGAWRAVLPLEGVGTREDGSEGVMPEAARSADLSTRSAARSAACSVIRRAEEAVCCEARAAAVCCEARAAAAALASR